MNTHEAPYSHRLFAWAKDRGVGFDYSKGDAFYVVREWNFWLGPLGFKVVFPLFWECRPQWCWGYWR